MFQPRKKKRKVLSTPCLLGQLICNIRMAFLFIATQKQNNYVLGAC